MFSRPSLSDAAANVGALRSATGSIKSGSGPGHFKHVNGKRVWVKSVAGSVKSGNVPLPNDNSRQSIASFGNGVSGRNEMALSNNAATARTGLQRTMSNISGLSAPNPQNLLSNVAPYSRRSGPSAVQGSRSVSGVYGQSAMAPQSVQWTQQGRLSTSNLSGMSGPSAMAPQSMNVSFKGNMQRTSAASVDKVSQSPQRAETHRS